MVSGKDDDARVATRGDGILAGKRILVTGGGTGLGYSMGRRFLELGARLAICGRRVEVLEKAAATLSAETGGEVATFGCDLRDAAAVEAMATSDPPLPRSTRGAPSRPPPKRCWSWPASWCGREQRRRGRASCRWTASTARSGSASAGRAQRRCAPWC